MRLWLLALLSSTSLFLSVEVLALHRSHWLSFSPGPYWSSFLLPWTERIWSGLMVLALSGGCASLVGDLDPRLWKRLRRGLSMAALAWGVALLALIPGLLALSRLKIAPLSEILLQSSMALLPPLLTALSAGAASAALPPASAAALGLSVGASLLWLWGLPGS